MGSPSGVGKGMAAIANAAAKRSNVAKFQAVLEQELDRGLFAKALDGVTGALNATRTVRVSTAEGIAYREVPDYAVQLAASVTILQYALGKPVNRTEMTITDESGSTAQQRVEEAATTLLGDPETLIGVLDDWKAAAEQAAATTRRAKPIELPVLPARSG